MVMVGWSVHQLHLTTSFPGKLEHAVNQYFIHILSLLMQQAFVSTAPPPMGMGGDNNFHLPRPVGTC